MQASQKIQSVLFVCLGNICRSPLAEGFAQAAMNALPSGSNCRFDSAALGDWHIGKAPDKRARIAAAHHRVDLSSQRARQIQQGDFSRFDLILGMDAVTTQDLEHMAPTGGGAQVALYLDFAGKGRCDVPDPYYGDQSDFDAVAIMLHAATASIMDVLAD